MAAYDGRMESGRERGFTLLELLVVLSIIAILALMALPTYIDKMVRDQVAEALPLADVAKPVVEVAWRAGAALPADNAAADLPPPDKIVSTLVKSVTLEQGAIHIVFGNNAHKTLTGKTLTLRPAVVEDARVVPVAWLCGGAAAPEKMTAHGEDRTTVPKGLLPVRCR
jgi:type IV pilus assembly protein PilA